MGGKSSRQLLNCSIRSLCVRRLSSCGSSTGCATGYLSCVPAGVGATMRGLQFPSRAHSFHTPVYRKPQSALLLCQRPHRRQLTSLNTSPFSIGCIVISASLGINDHTLSKRDGQAIPATILRCRPGFSRMRPLACRAGTAIHTSARHRPPKRASPASHHQRHTLNTIPAATELHCYRHRRLTRQI